MEGSLRSAARRVVEKAAGKKLTLATIESCTAGRLASTLARVPGAGSTLHGGFVTYTKVQKEALGVPGALIAQHTAVSMPVAEAMARAALAHSPADAVMAITGVAGPEPDEDGNPVGLVFVCVARRCGGLVTERHEFSGDHNAVCSAAMMAALLLAAGMLGKD